MRGEVNAPVKEASPSSSRDPNHRIIVTAAMIPEYMRKSDHHCYLVHFQYLVVQTNLKSRKRNKRILNDLEAIESATLGVQRRDRTTHHGQISQTSVEVLR